MFDSKVRDFLGLSKTEGEVGVEIEMEFTKQIPNLPYEGWTIEHDGSLRGISHEFVMSNPQDPNSAKDMCKDLYKKFKSKNGLKIKDSIRAGVHVHVNMQEQTIADVFRMMCVYYPLETALTNWCGEGRQGNLFCLRGKDAEYALNKLKWAVQEENLYDLRTDSLRYSAMNIQSLFSYGSIEFRALRTDPKLEKIGPWIDMLIAIKTYAINNSSPWQNLINISGMGPRDWAESVLGKDLFELINYPNIEQDIMEDARKIQMICHTLKKKGI